MIPTYQRPAPLAGTIESILRGTLIPTKIIIIDDGELSDAFIDEWGGRCKDAGADFRYHKKDHSVEPRGQASSKNIAIQWVEEPIICCLDDDVSLESDYFLRLMEVWKRYGDDPNLFAVGGKIVNNRNQSAAEHLFMRFFGLKSSTAWDVTDVGYQTWDEAVDRIEKAYFLHGGVCSYRTKLLRQLQFPRISTLEEVELGLRAKRAGYYGYYVPEARLRHYHVDGGRPRQFIIGLSEARNRISIYRRHADRSIKNRVWFFWSSVGWAAKKALSFRAWRQFFGMVAGYLISPPRDDSED